MSDGTKSPTPGSGLLTHHLPPVLFAAMIIAVSSIPDLPGPKPAVIGIDKVAHFLEYALFAFLIFRSMNRLMGGTPVSRPGLITLVIVILFALFDEYYQSHIPGRDQDLMDAVADWIGGTVVVGWQWLKKRKQGVSGS